MLSPTLFVDSGYPCPLENHFKGASLFLIAGGPSFAKVDHSLLRGPGCITLGLNNSPKTFRPNLWLSIDHPQSFMRSIWADPLITKFVCSQFANIPLFDSDKWSELPFVVSDCPNVYFFKRNYGFSEKTFCEESGICVGDTGPTTEAARSVLLAALKLGFHLGFANVFLLGVDFEMSEASAYHFEQKRDRVMIEGNNNAYRILEGYFEKLQPRFRRRGFRVFNLNPDSKLKAFPFLEIRKAVRMAGKYLPRDMQKERTEGLYERMMEHYQ